MQIKHWALILGGSSGIGMASAVKLAEKGMGVCVVYRERRTAAIKTEDFYDKLRSEGKSIITFNVNALDEAGRKTVIDELKSRLAKENGKIRLLLHSIARGNLKPLAPLKDETEIIKNELLANGINPEKYPLPGKINHDLLLKEEDYALTIQAMATSLLSWVNGLITNELFVDDARVVGLTSEGNKKAWRSYGAVSAAKVVLESLARSMAVELAPYGIRTNIIQAGITDTPSLRMIPGSNDIVANAIIRNPFHRLTKPEDIANVVYLLSTDEAAWINGSIINVDGGEQIA